MTPNPSLLNVQNLTKNFGNAVALAGVTFSLEPGEVLGVVGQRGSGKTTLFELLGGVRPPSSGEITWQGQRIMLQSTAHAQKLGIESVHQNPRLAENLDVVSNVFLGRELHLKRGLRVEPDDTAMFTAVEALMDEFEVSPDLIRQVVPNLSIEQRQIVALARALVRPSRLLLLDDPLAPLSFERQQKLIERINQLSAQNVAVIISSDDLKHIFSVTDRILVLYQGSQVALRLTSESTAREIVELVVGSNRQDHVTPVIWAFENYHAAQQQAEELRRAQQVLRQNLEAQDSLNRQLIEKLRDQVEALDRLNLALQDANRRTMSERENERKALARELHDQIIQDLLSFNYQLEESEQETADEARRAELAKIRGGIRQVVASLRDLCSDLRPPTIDSHGLSAAIRSLAHQWSEQTGVEVKLNIDPGLGRLPETIEISVFRIIQEGLRNVRKHSNASQVKLSLRRTSNASLIVQLKDNGKGVVESINLAALTEAKHFGLIGISERVSLLGGTLRLESPAEGGLEMVIQIPSPYPSIVN